MPLAFHLNTQDRRLSLQTVTRCHVAMFCVQSRPSGSADLSLWQHDPSVLATSPLCYHCVAATPMWLSPLRHWNITQVFFKNPAGAGVRCSAVVVACHYSPQPQSQLRSYLACLCTIHGLMGLTILSTPVAARSIQPTITTPLFPSCSRFTPAVTPQKHREKHMPDL